MAKQSPICVMGAGSWGTALAIHLARCGQDIHIWDIDQDVIQGISSNGYNPRYLSDIRLPKKIKAFSKIEDAISGTVDILIAVPSHAVRECLLKIKPHLKKNAGIILASKGLDPDKGQLLYEIVQEILGDNITLAVLSGPSFSKEVASGLPTAVTIASENEEYAKSLCLLFHNDNFRPYLSHDIIGAELGGVVKNALAIAVGISDGIGFGTNAKCALITLGLAEMTRLGMALGSQQQTHYGLSGIGDLILTSTDDQSRNRSFGLLLGKGLSVEDAKKEIGQTVEGARNTKEIYNLATRLNVEMPIIEQVYYILEGKLHPKEAINNLFARPLRAES